jgi:hypothetical protein
MKSLKIITYVERAKLLATLLPHEIEKYVNHLKQEAHELVKDQEPARQAWKGNFMLSFEGWVQMAQHVYNEITLKNKSIIRQPKQFADLLFFGARACYTVHHLSTYAETDDCPEPMRLAIKLLFTEWE